MMLSDTLRAVSKLQDTSNTLNSQLRDDTASAKEAPVEAGDGLGRAGNVCEAHPDLACAVAVYVARIYGPVLVRTLALDFLGQLCVPVLVLLSVVAGSERGTRAHGKGRTLPG